ncbi:MAG: recombinase family protein, partial [Ktedonobacterales bacterium]|nr:recombinase family protein [Ktedonobacterales bacterium]
MPPDARPCAVVRVSMDDQDLRQQLAEVQRWCAVTLGAELAEDAIYREQGVSGWRNRTLAQRPKLAEAVAGCLAGRYTHLVVHKVDRSARNVALMAG